MRRARASSAELDRTYPSAARVEQEAGARRRKPLSEHGSRAEDEDHVQVPAGASSWEARASFTASSYFDLKKSRRVER